MAKSTPRHKRLYSDSPTLERGADGNMDVVKPSQKKADEVQSGDEGVQAGDTGEPDTVPEDDARMQEIKDMHKRHQTEMEAIHKRHQKLDAKRYDNPKGDANEKPQAGKKEIEEVDGGKKITE